MIKNSSRVRRVEVKKSASRGPIPKTRETSSSPLPILPFSRPEKRSRTPLTITYKIRGVLREPPCENGFFANRIARRAVFFFGRPPSKEKYKAV
jgi:hypothetical protein